MFLRLIAAMMLFGSAAAAHAAEPVAGKWITTERDSIIEIGPCGANLCGKILRILKPTADGGPALDKFNPDPALKNRPVLGMTILSGFADTGKNWKGRIYDPKSGKTYKSILTRASNGTLKVQGCIAFLCQTVVWSPAR